MREEGTREALSHLRAPSWARGGGGGGGGLGGEALRAFRYEPDSRGAGDALRLPPLAYTAEGATVVDDDALGGGGEADAANAPSADTDDAAVACAAVPLDELLCASFIADEPSVRDARQQFEAMVKDAQESARLARGAERSNA